MNTGTSTRSKTSKKKLNDWKLFHQLGQCEKNLTAQESSSLSLSRQGSEAAAGADSAGPFAGSSFPSVFISSFWFSVSRFLMLSSADCLGKEEIHTTCQHRTGKTDRTLWNRSTVPFPVVSWGSSSSRFRTVPRTGAGPLLWSLRFLLKKQKKKTH